MSTTDQENEKLWAAERDAARKFIASNSKIGQVTHLDDGKDEVFLKLSHGVDRMCTAVTHVLGEHTVTPRNYQLNELGEYVPAIPEPFWVRHWLFWARPGCYICRIKFRNRTEWDEHYTKHHFLDEEG